MTAIDIYADYVDQIAAADGGIARTNQLATNLAYLAQQAAAAACVDPVTLQTPDFDDLEGGVFFPANNSAFLAAHEGNVADLRAALQSL